MSAMMLYAGSTCQEKEEKKKTERTPALRVELARSGTHTRPVRGLAGLDGYSTSWLVNSFFFMFFSFADLFEIVLGLWFDSNEFLLIHKIINIPVQVNIQNNYHRLLPNRDLRYFVKEIYFSRIIIKICMNA
jgi:hypothetical protein